MCVFWCVCVCIEISPLWCGVCRNLQDNDITTISSGTFEGLGSLTVLCAQRWCRENGAVWDVEWCVCAWSLDFYRSLLLFPLVSLDGFVFIRMYLCMCVHIRVCAFVCCLCV